MRFSKTFFALAAILSTTAFASEPGSTVRHVRCEVSSQMVSGKALLIVKSIEGLKVVTPSKIQLNKGNGISMKGQSYWAVVPTGIPDQQLVFNAAIGNAADSYRLGDLEVSVVNNGKRSEAAHCRLPSTDQFD